MKFLIDENLAHTTAAVLTAAGHEATRVQGAEDDQTVLAHARRERAVLVTADMDFADLRVFPLHMHAGIIVLRAPHPAVITLYNALLELFLRHVDVTRTVDRLTIVQRDRYRIVGPTETQHGPLFGGQ
jgi:predicted nuclease of predicted toxin-antitoxin system